MTALSLFAPRRFVQLVASDAMNISRDPMLMGAIVMSLIPAVAFFFGREPMNAAALEAFGIQNFSLYAAPMVLLIPAMLVGWVTGFLLLEDRDDGPLLAVDVTPVGKGGFLGYRVTVTAIVTAAVTLYAAPLVIPEFGWGMALLMTLLIAAEAAMVAVTLPAVARNKVEGLALTKLINLASVVPLLAIVPSPLRLVGGFFPSYWIGELLDLSGQATLPFALTAALAIAVHAAVLVALFRLLGRRAG
jgi:hypothetical protein